MASDAKFNDRKTAEHVFAAGFFVFRRNEDAVRNIEFLLLGTASNNWTPPKGHLESGEAMLDAAYREVEEESGLKNTDLKVYEHAKLELSYTNNFNRPKTVTYWIAELVNKNSQVKISKEHVAFKWLTPEEAIDTAIFDNMKDGIRAAHEKVKQLIEQS